MKAYINGEENTYTLPLCVPAPIKAYLPFAIVSNIIMANTKSEDWLLNNFIQLFKKNEINRVDTYPNQDFIYRDNVMLSVTELNGFNYELDEKNLVNQIVKWIDKGNYVVMYIDESQLAGARNFGVKSALHSQLIFGYNLEKKVFKIFNFDASSKDLSVFEVGFDAMIEAFTSEKTKELYHRPDTHGTHKGKDFEIILLRMTQKIDETYNFSFNVEGINTKLKEYLYGINTSKEHLYFTGEQKGTWGIEIYKELIKLIEEEKESIRYTSIYLIYEHKAYMLYRFQKLEALGVCKHIAESYKAVLKTAEVLNFLGLKERYRPNKRNREEMKKNLELLYEQEKAVLNKYFEQVER